MPGPTRSSSRALVLLPRASPRRVPGGGSSHRPLADHNLPQGVQGRRSARRLPGRRVCVSWGRPPRRPPSSCKRTFTARGSSRKRRSQQGPINKCSTVRCATANRFSNDGKPAWAGPPSPFDRDGSAAGRTTRHARVSASPTGRDAHTVEDGAETYKSLELGNEAYTKTKSCKAESTCVTQRMHQRL